MGRLVGMAALSRGARPHESQHTMPGSPARSSLRSRRFSKKPRTFMPNCCGGSHDPTSAHRLVGGSTTAGAEHPSRAFVVEHQGVGVRLTGYRPGPALL